MRPAHELVQPALALNEFVARPQIQMVGIGQDQAGTEVVELSRGEGFDRRLGAHGGKQGRFEIAVRRMKDAGPRLAVDGLKVKGEHCEGIHKLGEGWQQRVGSSVRDYTFGRFHCQAFVSRLYCPNP